MTRTTCLCPPYPLSQMTSQRTSAFFANCVLRASRWHSPPSRPLRVCAALRAQLELAFFIFFSFLFFSSFSLKLDRDQRITKAMESLSCTANFLITFGHMAIVLAIGWVC